MKTGEHVEDAVVIAEKKDSLIPVENTPDQLIKLGIEKGMPIEQLERLMALQERWIARIAEEKFGEALSAFQAEVPEIKKNKKVSFPSKTGGTVTYWYAPLGDIDKQIKSLMEKHGLSKKFKFEEIKSDKDVKIKVRCIIGHVAGHKEETEMEAFGDDSGNKNLIQQKGSAIEYMKRYTLIGALGLTTTDSDVDARGAALNQNQTNQKEPENQLKPPTAGQWAKIKDRFQKKEVTLDKLKTMFIINVKLEEELKALTLPEPTDEQYTEIMREIIGKKITLEELVKLWNFTETQRKALEVINDNNKKPKK